MFYAIPGPDGEDVWPGHDDGREARWSLGRERVFEMLTANEIIWKQRKRNGESVWVPYTREYAPEDPTRPHATILLDVKTSRQAKAQSARDPSWCRHFRHREARASRRTHPGAHHGGRRPRPRLLPRLRYHRRRGAQDGPALDRHRDGRSCGDPLRPAPAQGDRGRAGRHLQGGRLEGRRRLSPLPTRSPGVRRGRTHPGGRPLRRSRRPRLVQRDRTALERKRGFAVAGHARRPGLRPALQRHPRRPASGDDGATRVSGNVLTPCDTGRDSRRGCAVVPDPRREGGHRPHPGDAGTGEPGARSSSSPPPRATTGAAPSATSCTASPPGS